MQRALITLLVCVTSIAGLPANVPSTSVPQSGVPGKTGSTKTNTGTGDIPGKTSTSNTKNTLDPKMPKPAVNQSGNGNGQQLVPVVSKNSSKTSLATTTPKAPPVNPTTPKTPSNLPKTPQSTSNLHGSSAPKPQAVNLNKQTPGKTQTEDIRKLEQDRQLSSQANNFAAALKQASGQNADLAKLQQRINRDNTNTLKTEQQLSTQQLNAEKKILSTEQRRLRDEVNLQNSLSAQTRALNRQNAGQSSRNFNSFGPSSSFVGSNAGTGFSNNFGSGSGLRNNFGAGSGSGSGFSGGGFVDSGSLDLTAIEIKVGQPAQNGRFSFEQLKQLDDQQIIFLNANRMVRQKELQRLQQIGRLRNVQVSQF